MTGNWSQVIENNRTNKKLTVFHHEANTRNETGLSQMPFFTVKEHARLPKMHKKHIIHVMILSWDARRPNHSPWRNCVLHMTLVQREAALCWDMGRVLLRMILPLLQDDEYPGLFYFIESQHSFIGHTDTEISKLTTLLHRNWREQSILMFGNHSCVEYTFISLYITRMVKNPEFGSIKTMMITLSNVL